MNAIEVNNISKLFHIPREKKYTVLQNIVGMLQGKLTYNKLWALKDISFTVEKGETLGIIGRNGSGKSTLLKILARVLYPDSGVVTTTGKIAPFLELGVGFQPELTAEENIYIYSSILGISNRKVRSNLDNIFEFAELQSFRNMKLKNYSSGMYVRLAFSTAIYAQPDILLIDEVLAVGDQAFQKKCTEKIQEYKANGRTIILVTHSMDSVKNICNKCILLTSGRITSIGDTNKVIEKYLSSVDNI